MEVILTTYNTWDYPPSMYFPILSSYFFRILPKRPMMMPCCNASRVILIWLDPPRPRQVEGMSLSFWKESPHLEWADTNNLHVSCIQKNRTFTPFFGWDFQKEIKKKTYSEATIHQPHENSRPFRWPGFSFYSCATQVAYCWDIYLWSTPLIPPKCQSSQFLRCFMWGFPILKKCQSSW